MMEVKVATVLRHGWAQSNVNAGQMETGEGGTIVFGLGTKQIGQVCVHPWNSPLQCKGDHQVINLSTSTKIQAQQTVLVAFYDESFCLELNHRGDTHTSVNAHTHLPLYTHTCLQCIFL